MFESLFRFFVAVLIIACAFSAQAQSTVSDSELGSNSISFSNVAKISNSVTNDLSINVFDISDLSEKYREIAHLGITSAYRDAPFLDNALALFDTLILMRPDRPEGFFLNAALYYSIALFDRTEEVTEKFTYNSEKAIELTNTLLEEDPENPYYYFYLGAVHGNLGLQNLELGNYWRAYRNGSKGKSYLEKALEIDPKFADAKLGIGMFQYYLDILPKYLKFFLFFVRFKGDREEGLENVHDAAQEGLITRIEANYFLARVYNKYEGRVYEAEKLFQSLYEAFPDNYYFRWSLARFYYENGNLSAAHDLFEKFLKVPHKYYNQSIRYYLGVIAHETGNYSTSNGHFYVLLNLIKTSDKEQNKSRLRDVYYRIGLNYEYQSDRKSAVRYYSMAMNVDSDNLKDELKERSNFPITPDELHIRSIEALLKAENYTAALITYDSQLPAAHNGNDGVNMSSNIALLKSEVSFYMNNIDSARNFFSSHSEDDYKSNEYRVRYNLLGARLGMNSSNMDIVEMYIKRASELDLQELPIFYVRVSNGIQHQAFGSVLYR